MLVELIDCNMNSVENIQLSKIFFILFPFTKQLVVEKKQNKISLFKFNAQHRQLWIKDQTT